MSGSSIDWADRASGQAAAIAQVSDAGLADA
jgi:hypothetical protein